VVTLRQGRVAGLGSVTELPVVADRIYRRTVAGVGTLVAAVGGTAYAVVAIGRSAATTSAAAAGLAGAAEQTVVAGTTLVCRARLAGIGSLVAASGVALVTGARAIGGAAAAADARGAGLAGRAEQAVVTGRGIGSVDAYIVAITGVIGTRVAVVAVGVGAT